ncbi:MAG: hypothetical protein ACLUKN_02050 [Bacilli bacterium]
MKEHFFHILSACNCMNEDILWENEGESAQFKRLETHLQRLQAENFIAFRFTRGESA